MLQRTLSAKLMREEPEIWKWPGVWRLEPAARRWSDTGGAFGNYWAGQVLVYDGVSVRERGRDSNSNGNGPRTVPQLWECGLHWSGSIGNNKTDARGWNWALDPAMDGEGLIEVGAEVNGCNKRSHDRTDHKGGLMWIWMLDVGC